MWGFEYALLFGIPKNKPELIESKTRCAFPFRSREEAEAHFADWIKTLCRWKGTAAPPAVKKTPRRWTFAAEGWSLKLAPRPIEVYVPFDFDTYEKFYSAFWRHELWDLRPGTHVAPGFWAIQQHSDVQHNLWSLFGEWTKRHGGKHCGRVDILLSDTTLVTPDQFYFSKAKEGCLVNNEYFQGDPDLVAEVLSPGARAIDRGPRKEVYRHAGIPHLWLLDPEEEIVEGYALEEADYRLSAAWRAGQEFRPALFPEESVAVKRLFDTQWKRHEKEFQASPPEALPEWLFSPDKRLGLESLLLLGHPERRYEIWGNRAPCLMAFGSVQEARVRLGHFLEEAGRWEHAAAPQPAAIEEDVEQAEVGRFRFTRRGRCVQLDVAVDGRKYREMAAIWHDRKVWDWGEN